MKISPHSLYKLKEEHTRLAQEAAANLSGDIKDAAKIERLQAQDSQMFYVDKEATEKVLENLETNTVPEGLPSESGWLVFEDGTGLFQPCSPYPQQTPFGFSSQPEVEILGVFWFLDINRKLVICPVFKADDLRKIDPNLAPKKYYTTYIPFMHQGALHQILGNHPKMELAFKLFRSAYLLMDSLHQEDKKIRVGNKKQNRSARYTLITVPDPQEVVPVEEDFVILNVPSDDPSAVPMFFVPEEGTRYITVDVDSLINRS